MITPSSTINTKGTAVQAVPYSTTAQTAPMTTRRRPQLPPSPEDLNEMFYQGYEPGEPINDPEPMTTPRTLVSMMPPAPMVLRLDSETIKSVKNLTPAEKSERIGCYIMWSGGENYKDENGMPMWCAGSPVSGWSYPIKYSVELGAYVCACEGCKKAQKAGHEGCYHLIEWQKEFGEIVAPYLTARADAAASRRRVESDNCRAAFDAMPREQQVATVRAMIARDF